jgi:hypothetical protein
MGLQTYDVVFVGGGPASLYGAYTLIQKNKKLKIAIIEKGESIENRSCPAIKDKKPCYKCKVCDIMSGIAGAGAFSDGKFPITNDFGGSLWEKIGKEESLKLQREVDDINKQLYYKGIGCKEEHNVKWLEYNHPEQAFPKLYSSKNSVYKKICTQHNLHLLDADIRHLGTDKAKIIFTQLEKELIDLGIKFYHTTVKNIYRSNNSDYKYTIEGLMGPVAEAWQVVIATGRSGNELVSKICKDNNIHTTANKVDLGIRFECPNEIWDHITKDLYESKIIYKTKTYEDEVRTFCMNPSGEVVTENTNGLITVNGHAFEAEDKKTENTNFALLVSLQFTEPFNDSNDYGNAIVKLSNMLGNGVIVQRYGDLIRGKRSTKSRLERNSVSPTLNAEPGDLSLVLPKRILDDIIEMIERLDHLVPGMTNDDNLLYGVEVKNYNFKTEDIHNGRNFEVMYNVFMIGDGSGWTHSLSQAAASGVYLANNYLG